MQVLLNNLPAATSIFVILAALALILSGISLIGVEARHRREALAHRVQSVQNSSGIATAGKKKRVVGAEFIRVPAGSLTERDRRVLMRQLRKLSVPDIYVNVVFVAVRLLLTLGIGFSSLPLLAHFSIFSGSRMITVLAAMGMGILGWFVLPVIVHKLARDHETAVVSGLPDALELLVICVEAGLSLEDGLGRITGELTRTHPELAEELALTLADLKILPSRELAFGNLAARVDVPTIRSVVTTLVQTMRYGTPLAQALRVVATEMRSDSLIAMEGRANRLPALLTVPMMLFIMPTIFLIVGGPAALRVIDTFLK